jgi:hypothetical protein
MGISRGFCGNLRLIQRFISFEYVLLAMKDADALFMIVTASIVATSILGGLLTNTGRNKTAAEEIGLQKSLESVFRFKTNID